MKMTSKKQLLPGSREHDIRQRDRNRMTENRGMLPSGHRSRSKYGARVIKVSRLDHTTLVIALPTPWMNSRDGNADRSKFTGRSLRHLGIGLCLCLTKGADVTQCRADLRRLAGRDAYRGNPAELHSPTETTDTAPVEDLG